MQNYNILYNNQTGRIIMANNMHNKCRNRSISPVLNRNPKQNMINQNNNLPNLNKNEMSTSNILNPLSKQNNNLPNLNNSNNQFYKKLEELNKLSGLSVSNNNTKSSLTKTDDNYNLPKYIDYLNSQQNIQNSVNSGNDINNTCNIFDNKNSNVNEPLNNTFLNYSLNSNNIKQDNKYDNKQSDKIDSNNLIYNNQIHNESHNQSEKKIILNNNSNSHNNYNSCNSHNNYNSCNSDNMHNTHNLDNNNIILKKDLTYGIKKTILSDFNYLYYSSNSNDFKIGLNKNNQLNTIFDVFYLFPNISEINTKSETNIINEKKVEIFENIYSKEDKQYFPIDFIPCGTTIPLRNNINNFKKIKIKNIFWNIFQSIDSNYYKTNELLSIIPDKTDFKYIPLSLQINFELHAQVSDNFLKKNNNKIMPYRNILKSTNSANSCLFDVKYFTIETLNGSNFNNIIIDIPDDLNIDCAMICIKISVPDEFIPLLKGIDKYNKAFYGFIPFSQFVLNFDYELYC
jgi:hypothetical protein